MCLFCIWLDPWFGDGARDRAETPQRDHEGGEEKQPASEGLGPVGRGRQEVAAAPAGAQRAAQHQNQGVPSPVRGGGGGGRPQPV